LSERTNTEKRNGIAPERAARLMRQATIAAVSVAGVLVAVKVVAWLATDSVSLLSSLVDSVMDVLASTVNLLAVRHALHPADREHRFGHGKAEPLAGLGQAAFIAGSGVFLVFEAAGRFINPRPIEQGAFGISVMVFSIVLTIALVTFQRSVARRTGSTAISADSVHYASDVMVNAGVIGSLILVTTLDWQLADPIVAICVALLIMYAAAKIAFTSLHQLMDREFPDEERARIVAIVNRHPDVVDCHDLRTRRSGLDAFIQLHIEMDGALNLMRAHEVCDAVEEEIMAEFPNAEVIIHADPAGLHENMPKFARR